MFLALSLSFPLHLLSDFSVLGPEKNMMDKNTQKQWVGGLSGK